MDSFRYLARPANVVFGFGTRDRLAEELAALGVERPLILTTSFQAELGEEIVRQLGNGVAGLFAEAAMHTPVDVTTKAMALFNAKGADGVVAIGGGSTIGLGKAIALRNDAAQLVLPTTYAGSEMTAIIGQTEDGLKTTQKTPKVLPETVIYDVDFTLSLPGIMSVTSGINAIAHAVEALYAQNANPVLSLMAEQGIAALMRALAVIVDNPTDRKARYGALYGAWLCGICLGASDVALHHKLCHVLGGSFDLPHAETHTIVLPHALAYNASAVEPAMAVLRHATGSENPCAAIYDLAKAGGAPVSLKTLGMPEAGIARATELALANPYWNPRPLEAEGISSIICDAWQGVRPAC